MVVVAVLVLTLAISLASCNQIINPTTTNNTDANILPTSKGLKFELNEDGNSYSVVGIGTCTDIDIVISNTYEGLPVTSIGDNAFRWCGSLTSIEIPDSVTSIGEWAFAYCDSLTIYCEAESKLDGWDDDWNYSNCPVVWGYKGE